MKKFCFCCFKEELESNESREQKSTNLDSEMTINEKLNIVKEMIKKSVEHSKNNRVVRKNKTEKIIAVEDIPVYEDVDGKLKDLRKSRKMIFTE
jgi:hypothetical protein